MTLPPLRRALTVLALLALGACSSGAAGSHSDTASPSEQPRAGDPSATTTPDLNKLPDGQDAIARSIAAPPGSAPSGISVGPQGIWVTEHRAGAVAHLDPRTGRFIATTKLPGAVGNVEDAPLQTAHHVLLCVYGANRLVRIDPTTAKIDGVLRVPCEGMGSGPLGVWVAAKGTLTHVDPDHMTIARQFPESALPDGGLDITEAGGSLWIVIPDGSLLRVDPATGHVTHTFHLPGLGGLLTTDGAKRVFVSDPADDVVRSIDVATNTVRSSGRTPGSDPGDPILTYGARALWLSTDTGGLARMDPTTLKVTWSAQLDYQDYVGEVGVGGGYVWYPGYGADEVLQVRLPA